MYFFIVIVFLKFKLYTKYKNKFTLKKLLHNNLVTLDENLTLKNSNQNKKEKKHF